jgi:hypothetical protein
MNNLRFAAGVRLSNKLGPVTNEGDKATDGFRRPFLKIKKRQATAPALNNNLATA